MKNPYFIVNPVSGGGLGLTRFNEIQTRLDELAIPYTALYSESGRHVTELTRRALQNAPDIVVAVGGDGTVREVGQELLHTGVPLGILPVGTGNDLSRSLGIARDHHEAFDQLLSCGHFPMDAATANGKLYLNVSGFGFDVDVLIKTERHKRRFGAAAYVLGLLHAIIGLRSYRITAETPDDKFETDIMLIAAGNGRYFGGGMMVTPQADVSDGLLDFCIVKAIPRRKVFMLFSKFMKGRHVEFDFVNFIKATEMTLTCSPAAKVQLDGEIIEETPVTFKILPGALSVVRPYAEG